MENHAPSRRRFFKSLILAAAAIPLLGKFLLPRSRRRQAGLQVDLQDIPGQGALVFREKKIAVIRQGQDLYALDLACPHLGCTVNATPQGFACPCHGSVFSTRGEVLRGPADRPLPRLTIEKQGDKILIMS